MVAVVQPSTRVQIRGELALCELALERAIVPRRQVVRGAFHARAAARCGEVSKHALARSRVYLSPWQ